MIDKETERLLRVAHSPVVRAFGFGVDSLDLAKHLLRLREDDPPQSDLLFDIADRVLFVDYLRFETGWEIEDTERGVGDNLRFSDNLDALETYLLCTCIDTLAGARSSVSFCEWIRANPQEVRAAFAEIKVLSSTKYTEVTEHLFDLYTDAKAGLTRRFVDFFRELPEFVKRAIANSLILIKGHYLSKDSRERWEQWNALSLDKKVARIARKYLYGIRRSKYTHSSHTQEAAWPGHWRRAAERGDLPTDRDRKGWRFTLLRSAKNPDKVKYTLLTRGSKDESFLLRAVIAIYVLSRILEYPIQARYLDELLRYYEAVTAIYAFLHEMRQNRDIIDFLTTPQAVTSDNNLVYFPLSGLSIVAGEWLLESFSEFVHMEQDIRSYCHWVRNFNDRIDQFNTEYPPKKTDWQSRKQALARFSQELLSGYEVTQLLSSHRWVYSNLKRHVESGQIHYRFAGIIPSWSSIWRELQNNLVKQPRCPDHPDCPHIRTLNQGVINDIIEVNDKGITVRSHRTCRERFIPASKFEAWWNHLVGEGSALLSSPPRTGHGRIVGAIIATSLPDRIRLITSNQIDLVRDDI